MFKKKLSTAAAWAVLATAATAATAAAQAPPPPLPPPPTAATAWAGAPRTTEEDRQFKINGRIQYDVYNVKANFLGTGLDEDYMRTGVRRFFLGVEGRFTQNWRYNIKAVLSPGADDNLSEVGIDDAFLEYAGSNYSVFIGQNNAISPMEDRTSSLEIPFNERSAYINAFGFAKIMGVAYLTNGGNWSLGAGLYGDDLQNAEPTAASADADEPLQVIARGTFAPIYQKTPQGLTVLHLGLTGRVRDNGGDAGFRYRARPSVGFGQRFIDTSTTFKQDTFYGGEIAFQHNAFGAEAEYGAIEAKVNAPNGASRNYSGGFVDVFWSPTGESRNYNAADGSFGRITPFRVMGSDGGIGHIMLSARYDWVDLADGPDGGAGDFGEQKSITGGVTWKPISYLKFQLNYSQNDIDLGTGVTSGAATATTKGDAQVVTFRTQIDW